MDMSHIRIYYEKEGKDSRKRLNSLWSKTKLRKIKEMINSSSVYSILDVGCGVGDVLYRIEPSPHQLYGVDLAFKNAYAAQRLLRSIGSTSTFIVADAQKIPFRDNSFDIVIASESLEHLPNDQKAIDEMYRVLKRTGYIIITVPVGGYLSRREKSYGHLRRYSKDSLVIKLKKSGFIIEKSSFWGFPICEILHRKELKYLIAIIYLVIFKIMRRKTLYETSKISTFNGSESRLIRREKRFKGYYDAFATSKLCLYLLPILERIEKIDDLFDNSLTTFIKRRRLIIKAIKVKSYYEK